MGKHHAPFQLRWLWVPLIVLCGWLIVGVLHIGNITSKVISGQVLTCDSTPSWWLYSAVPLGDQAAGTMTRFYLFGHSIINNSIISPLIGV